MDRPAVPTAQWSVNATGYRCVDGRAELVKAICESLVRTSRPGLLTVLSKELRRHTAILLREGFAVFRLVHVEGELKVKVEPLNGYIAVVEGPTGTRIQLLHRADVGLCFGTKAIGDERQNATIEPPNANQLWEHDPVELLVGRRAGELLADVKIEGPASVERVLGGMGVRDHKRSELRRGTHRRDRSGCIVGQRGPAIPAKPAAPTSAGQVSEDSTAFHRRHGGDTCVGSWRRAHPHPCGVPGPSTEGRPMAVYYSFHYDRDHWRVQQVINMGLVEGQPLLNSQDWEEVRKKGQAAIEKWISDNMAYKSAVVVLVGAETANHPWVRFEIVKAWNEKRPLVGIRIHGLKDQQQSTDAPRSNPFALISLKSGGTLADFVSLHNPNGLDSKTVYATTQANLKTWAANGYARS